MQIQISKKIIFYLSILLLLGTINNKKLFKLNFKKSYNFNITSLSEFDDSEIINNLSYLKQQNLFLLKKDEILENIQKYDIVKDFYIFKNYPLDLIIKIEKTKFLAVTKKNGSDFYIGSNGKLIKAESEKSDLPFVFGNIEVIEFLKFKKIIDGSNFNFNEIQNFYYFKSKRWDIETKDGLIIKLPSNNLEKSFELITNIIKNSNLTNINYLDLRQDNQIILNG